MWHASDTSSKISRRLFRLSHPVSFLRQEVRESDENADDKIGAMNPGDMITTKIPLERVVEDGIKSLIADKEKHVKILVEL
jgi:hypothetical protein